MVCPFQVTMPSTADMYGHAPVALVWAFCSQRYNLRTVVEVGGARRGA